MTREEVALAMSTISWCEQMESEVRDGNTEALAAARQFLREWAADLSPYDVIVWLKAVRAGASEILREGEE